MILLGRCVGAFLLLTLAVSCSRTDAQVDRIVTRDSAGVRIVENAAPAWGEGEAWRVSPEPALEIGVVEGRPEYQLFGIVGAVRLSDGRIVVANAGSHELRFYDSAGKHLQTVGGEGAGPGEYGRLRWIARIRGDTLLAWDSRHHRVTRYAPNGQLISTVEIRPLDAEPSPPDAAVFSPPMPEVEAAFADGSLLARPVLVFPSPPPGVSRFTRHLLRYGPTGRLVDTLAAFKGREWLSIEGEGARYWGPLQFGVEPQLAVHGERLFWGHADSYRIDVLNMNGTLETSIRTSVPRGRVTAEMIARHRDSRLAVSDPEVRRQRLKIIDATPFPDSMPAHGDLRVDARGYVWVEDYRPFADTAPRWQVFDGRGHWLGAVEMPADLRVLEIGEEYVLGRWKDELDVDHIRLHRLEGPRD